MKAANLPAVAALHPFLSGRAMTLISTVLLLVAGSAQGQTPAPAGRVIARSGTELVARAEGVPCGPRVKVIITSTNAKAFEGEIPTAAKFFTNARAGHSLSCPQMKRMVAQGRNGD
jgi:hypothetical protein